MAGKTKAEKFIFPRIPLRLEVPEGLPDIGQLNSMTVVPVLEKYEVHNGEVELWGGYNLKVFYRPVVVPDITSDSGNEEEDFDNFFGYLQMQADGLFDISEQGHKYSADTCRICSWEFEKKFHTYAEVDGIKPGKKVQLQPTIEKIDLKVANPRALKGALTVALDIKRG